MRWFVAFLWLLLSIGIAHATVTIDASNPAIFYSPGNWLVQTGSAGAPSNGAYTKVLLNNTANITVTFSANNQQVYYRVDGPGEAWILLANPSGAVALTMPADTNTLTTHSLEIVWTYDFGYAVVTGNASLAGGFNNIIIDTGGTASAYNVKPKNMLAYGDSITAGALTLNPVTGQSDARYSWAWQMQEWLGVEVGMVGYSGSGWTSTSQMALSSSWNVMSFGNPRSIANIDFIVIADGQNDSADPTSACLTTVNAMLAAGKSTLQIVLLEPLRGQWATQLQTCRATNNAPSRVFYVDTTGFQATVATLIHPPGWDDMANVGPKIAKALLALNTNPPLPSGGWHRLP